MAVGLLVFGGLPVFEMQGKSGFGELRSHPSQRRDDGAPDAWWRGGEQANADSVREWQQEKL